MKTVEATGKDLNEALENGLNEMKVRLDEVDYEVISETDELTTVKLTIKEARQHLQELTTFILTSCGFRPNISITKDEKGLYLNIKTKHTDAILIGKKGETLWALQYLISRLMKRFHPNLKILVDVGGYRNRRNNFLKKKAEAIARIVLQTGREMALDPLTKKEQQIVESKLSEIKGVKIYTIGKGVSKNVIIAPSDDSDNQ
ncbi:MAG: Jag N-terminal domain-containing protein [candidate division WOR-3 bacterium]|nr:MAG: Jag N-terminal domain-containing protein [candidate division WOR-3 bacterium]